MTDNATPLISIVIPTVGRACLIQTLQSLASASLFDRVEVLVAGRIHAPEIDAEFQALRARHAQIRHLPVSFDKGDSSAKKNAGAQAARSGLVAFLDDDVIVPGGWIAAITAAFENQAVNLVTGPALPPDDISLAGRLAAQSLSSAASGYVARRYTLQDAPPFAAPWSTIIGCNMAWRRAALEKAGGFDVQFWPGEEMLAAFRAEQGGNRLYCVPAAWLWHMPRQTLAGFWRQIQGYGATRIRLIRAGVTVEYTTLIPAAWVLSLAVLIPAAFFSRAAAWVLLAETAVYSLLPLTAAARAFARHRRSADLLLALMIPMMHLSYGLAEWREFLQPGRDFSGTLKPKAS